MSQQPATKAVEWWTMWTMWTVIFMTGRNTVTHSCLTNFTHHRSTGVSCQRHEVLLLWCRWKCFRCSISVTSRAGGMQVNTWISMDINESNMNQIWIIYIFIYGQCTVASWSFCDSEWRSRDEWYRCQKRTWIVDPWLPWTWSDPKGSRKNGWWFLLVDWWGGSSFFGMRFWCMIMICFSLLVADHFWNVCTTLM